VLYFGDFIMGVSRTNKPTQFTVNSVKGIDAIGGTVTNIGGYRIHTFTGNGQQLQITAGSSNIEYLIVGAGGGGGGGDGAGGGGGGEVKYGFVNNVSIGSYAVVLGSGGATPAGSNPGSNGTISTMFTLTSIGGGGGGKSAAGAGAAGACGGGGGYGGLGGTGTVHYNGGNGGSPYPGGGGGGAGGTGFAASGTSAGNGGIALFNSISGASAPYAAGGGGGANDPEGATQGIGGSGIGGNGEYGSVPQTGGLINTGSGAGGMDNSVVGISGGSGIVIVRYIK
jgi:hypothetical protein